MINPLASRELLTRFRNTRSSWFVSVWLLSAAGIGYLTYLAARETARSFFQFQGVGGGVALASAAMGGFMFEALAFLLLTGILFIVPAIAALGIVSERERLTLQLLQVSQLGPVQIVMGKLVSALAYMLLLIAAVAPIMAVPLFIGGVTLREVLSVLGMLIAITIMVGAIGTWTSARARSVRGAVGAAYVWVFVLVVVTGLASIGEVFLGQDERSGFFPADGREIYTLLPNPYLALVSAVEEPLSSSDLQGSFFFGPSTPFAVVNELLVRRQVGDPFMFMDQGFVAEPFAGDAFDDPFGQGARELPQRRGPVWVRSLLIYTIVTALALWRASVLVSAPASGSRRLRLPRKESADAAA